MVLKLIFHYSTCWVSSEQREVIMEDNCQMSLFLGDGICDLNYNKKEYFFDIGDCCQSSLSTCRSQAPIFYSMVGNQEAIECPDNPCIPSNNYCIPHELGDGICQDHNNAPYCDYDSGDCCFVLVNHDECCDCACIAHEEQFSWIGFSFN